MSVLSTNIAITKAAADYSRITAGFNNNDIPLVVAFGLAQSLMSAIQNVSCNAKFYRSEYCQFAIQLNPKIAKLIITDTVTQATTTFTGTEWLTVAPPNIAGNYFISDILISQVQFFVIFLQSHGKVSGLQDLE